MKGQVKDWTINNEELRSSLTMFKVQSTEVTIFPEVNEQIF